MRTFKEYYKLREDISNLTLDDVRSMILRALDANPESKEAHDAPLTQFAEPEEIQKKLYSLKGLQALIQQNASAVQAVEMASRTNLTVGQLAGILVAKNG